MPQRKFWILKVKSKSGLSETRGGQGSWNMPYKCIAKNLEVTRLSFRELAEVSLLTDISQ